jgi:hypothetical protein
MDCDAVGAFCAIEEGVINAAKKIAANTVFIVLEHGPPERPQTRASDLPFCMASILPLILCCSELWAGTLWPPQGRLRPILLLRQMRGLNAQDGV